MAGNVAVLGKEPNPFASVVIVPINVEPRYMLTSTFAGKSNTTADIESPTSPDVDPVVKSLNANPNCAGLGYDI